MVVKKWIILVFTLIECMKKIIATIIILSATILPSFSQLTENWKANGRNIKWQKITGQILDLETSEPIPFASVYIKSESIGTTTNEEGLFVFHIPTANKESIVIISVIGYTSVSKKANTFGENQKILLSAKATNLDEVVITAKKKKELRAKKIVQRAYEEIKNNYPDKPYFLEGYVRDLQKEDENYVEYLECAVKFSYKAIILKGNL